MPSVSKAQQRTAGAAEHMSPEELANAGPAVQQMAQSMDKGQLHDFAAGSMKGKPEHKHHKKEHKRGEGHHGRQPKERGHFSK